MGSRGAARLCRAAERGGLGGCVSHPPCPLITNFALALDASARRTPDRVALIAAGERLTYQQLERRAGGFARWLHSQGVGTSDRVALILPNSVGFAVALWGALKMGATVTPLNPQLTAGERDRTLSDFRARVVVETVPDGEADVPAVEQVDAPAIVLYTSGSTGRAKGAVLSHAAVTVGNVSWKDDVMALTAADRVLAVLPLSHSYGINGALLAPLLAGACSVIVERFSPEAVVGAVREHAITVFPAVATMYQRLLDTPGWSRDDFRSVRIALSGAAPCPWPLAEAWRERSGVRILRGYGMTELHRPLSYLANDPRDFPDCVGRPVPGVEIRVVDDDGAPLVQGATGELLIRSDAAMDGYLGQPEETAAAMVDGWFKTGDLARVSPEGFVSIVGRKKELILRGGYSVSPPEVEAALLAHPSVTEAAVIGIPHPSLGEEIAAFVALRRGDRVTPDDLAAWCKTCVAAYKCPRVITIVPALPRGATGKVLKGELRSAAL
jgi:long-chain acyl-CoA synthetase